MADNAYQVKGVTITPQGGGYYDLTHPNLAEAVRVRGKELADQRAEEIAATFQPDEGRMDPQPSDISTPKVEPNEPVADEAVFIPASVPRAYTGQMDAKQKAALAKAGVKVETIILEENSDIPPTGLFVAHNGRGYMISPGEIVDVPTFVLNVLRDAIMSAPIVDNKTQRVIGYRDRMRYPFRPA